MISKREIVHEGDQTGNEREGEHAALERPVKPPTTGYSITQRRTAVAAGGTKRRIGMGNARMRRFMGNMVYLRLTGKSRRMEANRRGPRYPLSRPSFPFISVSHVEWKARGYWRRRLPLRCNTAGYWRDVGRARSCARRPRGCYDVQRKLSVAFRGKQDSNRINIKTINLDAYNGVWCYFRRHQQRHVASWRCWQSHNRMYRIRTIDKKIASEDSSKIT